MLHFNPPTPLLSQPSNPTTTTLKALRLFVDTLRVAEEKAKPAPDFEAVLAKGEYAMTKRVDEKEK